MYMLLPPQVLHAALGHEAVDVRLAAMRATTSFILVRTRHIAFTLIMCATFTRRKSDAA